MSWPVPGTLMIEPTESESVNEMERFCEAMKGIRKEIARIESNEWPRDNNPLVNAPHTMATMVKEHWDHPYSREEAAFPMAELRKRKLWPSVSRLDDLHGDLNLEATLKA